MAGNSSRPSRLRLQTTRNGGRSLIFECTWVRAGFTPYIGHWSAGRQISTLCARRLRKLMRTPRGHRIAARRRAPSPAARGAPGAWPPRSGSSSRFHLGRRRARPRPAWSCPRRRRARGPWAEAVAAEAEAVAAGGSAPASTTWPRSWRRPRCPPPRRRRPTRRSASTATAASALSARSRRILGIVPGWEGSDGAGGGAPSEALSGYRRYTSRLCAIRATITTRSVSSTAYTIRWSPTRIR